MATTPTRKTGEGHTKAAWTDEVEDLYRSWHRRVAAAERGHRLMADRMRQRYLMLGIPVVVLTTLVGTSAFASLRDASGTKVSTGSTDSDLVLWVVGSISILAAVLSSLQTFLRYATRAEGHRIGAIRYETLRRDMAKVLALPRSSRDNAERDLDSVRTRMDRYAKESPTIGERLWSKLAPEFHLDHVPPDPTWNREPVVIPDTQTAGAPETGSEHTGGGHRR